MLITRAGLRNSLQRLRRQLLFSRFPCGDAGRDPVSSDWQATRGRRMGHWLLQPLSGAVHAGTAGSGCLPIVGWRYEAGKAEKSKVRDWKERRQTALTRCRSAAAEALSKEVWEFWMCHRVLRVCIMCFLLSEAWASLLHGSCVCI